MISRRRTTVQKGSWRWAAHIAEVAAWGTAALILLVLSLADVPDRVYRPGVLLVVGLGAWLFVFFRILLRRLGPKPWVAWAGVTVDLGFSTALFALLRGEVSSSQFIFVPLIM